MAGPIIAPLTDEALRQFDVDEIDEAEGALWEGASSDGTSSFDPLGEPTYEVISKWAVDEEQDLCWFRAGWWHYVRITHVNPDILHGPVFPLDTITQLDSPYGPVFELVIPDEFESAATLGYLGFHIDAIPVLWARYYSIVKAGCYKPYDLWEFVSSCILRPYPKDARHSDSLDVWKEVSYGLQLDEEIIKLSKIRADRHEKSKDADRSFKSCVLWVMHRRWDLLFHMEVYTRRHY